MKLRGPGRDDCEHERIANYIRDNPAYRQAGPPIGKGTGSTGDADICHAMGTLAEILAALRRERARLFQRYALTSMAVFGSTARNENLTDSDVDIMVEFDTTQDYDFLELAEELERMLGRKVDLTTRKAVRPWYMEHIERDLQYV
jgi:hypothetical protein